MFTIDDRTRLWSRLQILRNHIKAGEDIWADLEMLEAEIRALPVEEIRNGASAVSYGITWAHLGSWRFNDTDRVSMALPLWKNCCGLTNPVVTEEIKRYMLTCADLEHEGLWQTSRCDDRCHEAESLRQTVLPDGRIAETCCFAQWELIRHFHLPWPAYAIGDRVRFMISSDVYTATITRAYPPEPDDGTYPGELWYGLLVDWPDGSQIDTTVYGREIGGPL